MADGPLQRMALDARSMSWPALWSQAQILLRRRGFQISTLRVYRQVLRRFRAFLDQQHQVAAYAPGCVSAAHVQGFVHAVVAAETSASWLSLNISVVRTVFDKLGGRELTRHLRNPRKPWRLPYTLSEQEVRQLVAVMPSARDRLLVGFLYGCGLKVGEACRLRWGDIDDGMTCVRVANRELSFPTPLRAVVEKGKQVCAPAEYIFQGARPGQSLTPRQAERIVFAAGKRAALNKPVCCMTLRHSYAMACLKAGNTIRAVQEQLGLKWIGSMLPYQQMQFDPAVVAAVNKLTQNISLTSAAQSPGASSSFSLPPSSPSLSPRHPSSIDVGIDPVDVDLPFQGIGPELSAFREWFRTHFLGRFLGTRSASGP